MVSSKAIQKARRNALRTRALAACVPCKTSKMKCNDYRPCKRCKEVGGLICLEPTVSLFEPSVALNLRRFTIIFASF